MLATRPRPWHRLLSLTSTVVVARAFAVPPKLHRSRRPTAPFFPRPRSALPSASDGSMWDPATQTYLDGVVPSHHDVDLDALLALNAGKLKIFGYGSLRWHPGSDGVLSLANLDEDERHPDDDGAAEVHRKVTTAPGRAIGYQRCWSQRSADHRGTTEFNGIVCTLLSDAEVTRLHHGEEASVEEAARKPSMTEGLIYTVDVDLVEDCLAELDFREKGGYARDVIDVVEDDTGNTVKALLYRGTPDNPAFWKRVLLDLPYAAAIMSVAVGPSGPNDIYLLHLHEFLSHAAKHSPAAALALEDHSGDFHTAELANMVTLLQSEYRPYFLFGAGSNEHGQLLLGSDAGGGEEGINEVQELTEMLLVAPRHSYGDGDNGHVPKSLHAGGGHSALLTLGGDLYLWGWNDAGQLGRAPEPDSVQQQTDSPLTAVQPLSDIKVETVDLGHTHTLATDKEGRLFAFGENGRGQVTGCADDSTKSEPWLPRTPAALAEERFLDVAAGLFHSAAITKQGELVTWGCGRFGQCLRPTDADTQNNSPSTIGRWRPADGSKLMQVACGRRHTAVLDEHGRIWTLGDNKYGQLGRQVADPATLSAEPLPIEGPLGLMDSGCFAIHSGWSHILALTRDDDSGEAKLFGWGRSDKGQLGMESSERCISSPQVLNPVDGGSAISMQSVCCGSESSHVLATDGSIFSSGWNEHGNLSIGRLDDKSDECCFSWRATTGARIVAPPPSKAKRRLVAAGGAHIITLAV